MTKLLKKDFAAALRPLREASEAAAMLHLEGRRVVPAIAPVVFAGHSVTTSLIRQSRTISGVPAPYHAIAIRYELRDTAGTMLWADTGIGNFAPKAMRMIQAAQAVAA